MGYATEVHTSLEWSGTCAKCSFGYIVDLGDGIAGLFDEWDRVAKPREVIQLKLNLQSGRGYVYKEFAACEAHFGI